MNGPRAALVAARVAVAGLAGCAHAPGPATAPASRCEEAAARLAARARTRAPERPPSSATARSATAGGRPRDGAAVGSAAATLGCLLLAPVLVLQAASGTGSVASGCASPLFGGAPPLLLDDDAATADPTRCPELVALAGEAEAVAGCYAARDAPGDRGAAVEALAPIRWSGEVWPCLPEAQRARIEETRIRLVRARDAAPPWR